MALMFNIPEHRCRKQLQQAYPGLYARDRPESILVASKPEVKKWWKIFLKNNSPLEELVYVFTRNVGQSYSNSWNAMLSVLESIHKNPDLFPMYVNSRGFRFPLEIEHIVQTMLPWYTSNATDRKEKANDAYHFAYYYCRFLSTTSESDPALYDAYCRTVENYFIAEYGNTVRDAVILDGDDIDIQPTARGFSLQDRLVRSWSLGLSDRVEVLQWMLQDLSLWTESYEKNTTLYDGITAKIQHLFHDLIQPLKHDSANMSRFLDELHVWFKHKKIFDISHDISLSTMSNMHKRRVQVFNGILLNNIDLFEQWSHHPALQLWAEVLPPAVYWSRAHPTFEQAHAYLSRTSSKVAIQNGIWSIHDVDQFVQQYPHDDETRLLRNVLEPYSRSTKNGWFLKQMDDAVAYYRWCTHSDMCVRALAVANILDHHANPQTHSEKPLIPFIRALPNSDKPLIAIRTIDTLIEHFVPELQSRLRVSRDLNLFPSPALRHEPIAVQLRGFLLESYSNISHDPALDLPFESLPL